MDKALSIIMIDNYDSFTMNLVHGLQVLGAEVEIFKNDEFDVEELPDLKADGICFSPGPGDPSSAGDLMELVAKAANLNLPMLGVCLGMQAIGQHFNVPVIRAPMAIHGKASAVVHDGSGLFAGVESPMRCGRYHSLCLDTAAIARSPLRVTGWCDGSVLLHDATWGNWSDPRVVRRENPGEGVSSKESGRRMALASGFPKRGASGRVPVVVESASASRVAMAVVHESKPIWGVQFHPESILTPKGPVVLENWLGMVRGLVGRE